MDLYLMRHGETDWNKGGILQGRVDTKLNDTGREQVQKTAEMLKEKGISFDRVYVSHLERAMDSATIVSGKGKGDMVIDDRIIEMEYGDWDGKTFDALDDEVKNFMLNPVTVPAPAGIEPLESLTLRVGGFLEDIKVWSKRQVVLVSSHNIAIRAMIAYIKGLQKPDEAIWEMEIGNGEIIHIPVEDGEYGEPEKLR